MTDKLTIAERITLAQLAHDEGRIIQGQWRRTNGKELVCALAAFGPDINSSSDCPAELMPPWLAELVPTLDDGIAAVDVPWFSGELIARARRWSVLDSAAWERVRVGFLIATVRQALASAAVANTAEHVPAYWPQVVETCEQVCTALASGTGLPEAAWAARSTAEARSAEAASHKLCEVLFAAIDKEARQR